MRDAAGHEFPNTKSLLRCVDRRRRACAIRNLDATRRVNLNNIWNRQCIGVSWTVADVTDRLVPAGRKGEPKSRYIPAFAQPEATTHRRFGADSDRQRSLAVRRRPSRRWEIDTLEDRVVPATITVTNLGDSGVGTLRAAIEQADFDSSPDTISFAPAVKGEINLLSALPDLSADITIAGPGPTVLTVNRIDAPGTPEFRVFTVPSGAAVAISGLTISGGRASSTSGGGISSAGTLTLTNDDLSGNSAGSDGGGGIANSGLLSIADCMLSGNSSLNPNGTSGIGGGGGAILNQPDSTISVAHCTISGNSSWLAGAVYNGGTMTITESTISSISEGAIVNEGTITLTHSNFTGNSNETAIDGTGGAVANGGISPFDFPSLTIIDCGFSGNSDVNSGGAISNEGAATIDACSFSANAAGFVGGAIDSGSAFHASSLTVANSTFSGNSSEVFGGAIANVFESLTVTNSTIYGNMSGADVNIGGGNGGGIANQGGSVTITDSTISGNFARGATGGGIASVPNHFGTAASFLLIDTIVAGNTSTQTTPFSDVSAAVQSASAHNLIGDGTGLSGITNGSNGNLIGTASAPLDPRLGPLANNGGPTFTMALLPGSPAINAGAVFPGVTMDQRGISRPQGSAPDIGAFEAQPPPTVTSVVRHGVHLQHTTIVVTFSHSMDVALAESPASYRLMWLGDDHKGGTPGVKVISIHSAVYDAASFSVTLLPSRRLPLHDTFWLTIRGKPPGGLTDAWGFFVDGKGNGQPGSNDVVKIDAKLLAPPFHHKRGKPAIVAHSLRHR